MLLLTAYFYPRPPRGGRRAEERWADRVADFYPRPPRGGRRSVCSGRVRPLLFLSTPSARRATVRARLFCSYGRFLSTPSARRATGDRTVLLINVVDFYPRPPRGGRPLALVQRSVLPKFLSTPSARRATGRGVDPLGRSEISIHALREEGDAPMCRSRLCAPISIHALREEGDCIAGCCNPQVSRFLSTPSARRATRPCAAPDFALQFLSTPSARRATVSLAVAILK